MKNKALIAAFVIVAAHIGLNLSSADKNSPQKKIDLKDFHLSKIDLKLPLLTIQGQKGFLACSYITPQTCNKSEEACAIVSGVKTHEDMLKRKIKSVSKKAQKLGVRIGMTGEEALRIFQ